MASLELGDFRITHIREAGYRWDGGVMFGVVPMTLWGRQVAPDELNRVPLAFNSYVIETGERTILVETAAGDKLSDRARERMALPPASRSMPEAVAASGIDPEDIDIVVNTHLHWDHCGGNTIGAAPAFPRAVYYTPRGEWEHAHERHVRDAVSYMDSAYDPLVESGRMCLTAREHEVAPGVWMRHAPGHNRDMTILTATSAGRTFCFFSDLVPTAAHVLPTWVAAFDLFPLETIDSKIRWLGQAAREDWVCGFGHDPRIAFVRVRPGRDRFEAADPIL